MLPKVVNSVFFLCELLVDRFGDSEVDDLHHRRIVVESDQNIRGL
jgi:hypothetical protein